MMLMKQKRKLLIAGISGLLFTVLIVLIQFVDVQAVGPEGTRIGLSHLNRFVLETLGVHMLWYEITDWFGIAAVVTAFLFAVTGLMQWMKRRNIWKVDKEILALGVLYLIVIGLYVLFELAVVNYRPIIMPDATEPEASFPSSHTMLICVVMASTIMVLDQYIKNKRLALIVRVACVIIMVITVVGRLVCGVHWLTDIIGGILISIALLTAFSGIKEL